MNRKYIVFVLVLVMLLAQACNKSRSIEEGATRPTVPEELEIIKVINGEGGVVREHRDPNDIAAIVAGLGDAEHSYADDPEPSGSLYKLELIGKSEHLTLTLNDLSRTNGTAPSVKVYATGLRENETQAWSLPTAWVQLVLQAASPDNDPPVMSVTIDEDSDSVVLIANREMDRASVEQAIQTSLYDYQGDTISGYRYAVEWTDDRRAVVRFTDLPPESAVGFMLEGSLTTDGKPIEIVLPQEGRVVVVRAGLPWSGIRTINVQGDIVREHGYDSVVLIQAPGYEEENGRIQLYYRDGFVDHLEPDTGEVSRTHAAEWPDELAQNVSDSGVGNLYAFATAGDDYYIARGLEYVYRVNPTDGTSKMIYQSDRAIYGLAASPDGGHVAVLTDSERILGSYADLLIVDAQGNLVSQYEKASYIGHSDGWHFTYPVTWRDNETVAVPLIARSDLDFWRGKAIYRIGEGLVAEEENPTMPEEAYAILKSAIPDWGGEEIDVIRALPRPNDDRERYLAVHIGGYGTFLIDRQDEEATKVGAGAFLGWSTAGNMLIWYSTEGKSPEIAIMD